MIAKSVIGGILAALLLLSVYFLVLTVVSGWDFANDQFLAFWYFILALALGFGIQATIYVYLRERASASPKGVMAASGTASAAAMVSCCAHYLSNIPPVLGVSGVISIISQRQIELFWLGLIINLAAIAYTLNRLLAFLKYAK